LVSYNTRELLCRAVQGVQDCHEVIVVDNASTDGSADAIANLFPDAVLIRNSSNRGFGAACNQGLDSMTGNLALILNSDAVPDSGAIDRLAEVMEAEPDAVACGGRLLFPDGRTQNSCCNRLTLWAVVCEQLLLEKVSPKSRLLSPYWQTPRLMDLPGDVHEVEQVMGACLMMRPVERFDENYFLYVEDTDLCHRLRHHGKILYVKDAAFQHELGASSAGARWMAVARYNRGKELYFRKHHGWWGWWAAIKLNRIGAFLRLIVWLIPAVLTLFLVPRFRNQVILFLRVLFARLSGPALPPDTQR
jgi:GT2 family glycosyltransferase